MLTYEQVRRDAEIREYLLRADESLSALGYTEHSLAHAGRVADTAKYILESLAFSAREVEIAQIAAYMHDIGNLVNRVDHSQSGAIIAFRLLDRLGMPAGELSSVVTAIGNHDEGTGVPVNALAAALILADKSDVRRSRVRNIDPASFDIHDRVNFSVTDSTLTVDREAGELRLCLKIDTEYGSVMDYFEIFLERMLLCRRASEKLGLAFRLCINGQTVL